MRKHTYFDIDGTLLLWPDPTPGANQPGATAVLNQPVIDALKAHSGNGEYIVIWSANPMSIEYLKTHHPGVARIADTIIIKPHTLYDDNREWINKRDWRIV